jgi:hypothetical protein
MDRPEIYQKVIDALGKILVDKDPIRDDELMSGLILDKADFDLFFSDLQADLKIVIPPRLKAELSELPDSDDHQELTLSRFVDLIDSWVNKRTLLKR